MGKMYDQYEYTRGCNIHFWWGTAMGAMLMLGLLVLIANVVPY